MNLYLIEMMSKCDGRNVNCEKCMFRDHPECRNAMARHAAAELRLNGVMLDNSRSISANLHTQREELREIVDSQAKALELFEEMCGMIAEELSKLKHCPTCKYNPESDDMEMSEICKSCQAGESEWLLHERLMPTERAEKMAEKPPEEAEDEPV